MSNSNLRPTPPADKLPPAAPIADCYTTVYAFAKNAQERVHASLSRFRGETYLLDLRVFLEKDDGTWSPTKKGVTLAPDCLSDLEEAVRRLRAAAEAAGLVERAVPAA